MPDDTGAKHSARADRRLVLVRHGETEWSQSGQHTSTTDKPLISAGERQARALRPLISRLQLRDPLVISSPRLRATSTAHLAGLKVNHTWDTLAEWDYGSYEGLTTNEIQRTVPGWSVWTQPCPGGESAEAVSARADRVLAVTTAQLAERDVILVGHGHFSRALIARWAGLAVVEGRRFVLSAGSATILGYERETPVILHHNISGPE